MPEFMEEAIERLHTMSNEEFAILVKDLDLIVEVKEEDK